MWGLSCVPPSTRQGPRPPSTSVPAPCRVGRVLSQGLRARARRRVQSQVTASHAALPSSSTRLATATQLRAQKGRGHPLPWLDGISLPGWTTPKPPREAHPRGRPSDESLAPRRPPTAGTHRVSGTGRAPARDRQDLGGRLNRGLPPERQLAAKGSRSPRPRPASGLRQEMLCAHLRSPEDRPALPPLQTMRAKGRKHFILCTKRSDGRHLRVRTREVRLPFHQRLTPHQGALRFQTCFTGLNCITGFPSSCDRRVM